jgi:hypothetical protein
LKLLARVSVLHADGRQGAGDVDQLLDVAPPVAAEVEERLAALPEECTELWQRIRSQRKRDPRRPGGPIS